jgi:hypothetical protein
VKEWTIAQVAQELDQYRALGFEPELTIRAKRSEDELTCTPSPPRQGEPCYRVRLAVGTFDSWAWWGTSIDEGLSYVFDSAHDLFP